MGKPGDEYGVVFKVLAVQARQDEAAAGSAGEVPLVRRELVPGLLLASTPTGHAEELRISCLGERLRLHGRSHACPIHMVDEPIYKRLPGFLIATVDKFAAMPWKGEVAKLFGRVKSYKRGVGFLGDCDAERGDRAGCLSARRRT